MEGKNLLLGYGETLKSKPTLPKPGGDKTHPYTFEKRQKIIAEKTKRLIEKIDAVSDDAKPNGKSVAKITLHPAYLAKSYYPKDLLKQLSLEDIGSRSVSIKPEVITSKRDKDKESFVALCMYVSGTAENFKNMYEKISTGDLTVGAKKDVRKIEDLDIFLASDKIKYVDQSKEKRPLQIALHNPYGDLDVVDDFCKYAELNGALVNKEKAIFSKGLTFLPANGNIVEIEKLAEFTYLRSVGDMSEIRFHKPIVKRSLVNDDSLEMPDEPAIDGSIKVAIFDGGVGVSDFSKWCEEETFGVSSNKTKGELLAHGQDVTSTVLFGLLDEEQKTLPIPYCNVHHYRVFDDTMTYDNDLFSVLKRITDVLDNNKFDFVNLSIGPNIPIFDDDVNPWTSTLEKYFSDGKTLCCVAVGNDGKEPDELNRIQPPSDMVNALAVGAASSQENDWDRCDYSSIGPGRSPGFIKPDGLLFGGTLANPFHVFSPMNNGLSQTAGTSFSAPLAMRNAIGLKAGLEFDINPLTAKALLIHHANKTKLHNTDEVGHGLFSHDLQDIIYSADNEVKVIYQDVLNPTETVRLQIPFPDIEINGDLNLKFTFCFASDIDPAHPINYTRSGLSVIFRRNIDDESDTQALFNKKNIFATESELRMDAHKWETTINVNQSFRKTSLNKPTIDVVYSGREDGKAVSSEELPPLPYVLIVSVSAKDTPDLYNNIVQRYQTLKQIQLRQEVRIQL